LSNKYDNLEPISKTDKPSFIVVTALLPKKWSYPNVYFHVIPRYNWVHNVSNPTRSVAINLRSEIRYSKVTCPVRQLFAENLAVDIWIPKSSVSFQFIAIYHSRSSYYNKYSLSCYYNKNVKCCLDLFWRPFINKTNWDERRYTETKSTYKKIRKKKSCFN
jgi:hypothetical protein